MERERAKILQMVADELITPEQGEQLLEAVERREGGSPASEPRRRARPRIGGVAPSAGGPAFELGDLPDTILRDVVREVRRGIRRSGRRQYRSGDIWGRGWSPRSGSTGSDFEQLIGLATMGIGPDYIRRMREAGLEDLTPSQAMELGAMGVSPDLVRELIGELGNVDYHDLLQVSAVGIDASYIRRCRDAGLEDLSIDKLVQMAALGVEPESFKEMRDLYTPSGSEEDDGGDRTGPPPPAPRAPRTPRAPRSPRAPRTPRAPGDERG